MCVDSAIAWVHHLICNMGNSTSCGCFSCKSPAERQGRVPVSDSDSQRGTYARADGSLPGIEEGGLTSSLQHIMDREHVVEEDNQDPSLHPGTSTLFLSKSQIFNESLQDSGSHKHHSSHHHHKHNAHLNHRASRMSRSSSCSTIFLDDSTVTQPNLKNTIKCVAMAIYYHIKNRESDRQMEIFDEKIHPLTKDAVPEDYGRFNPEHKHIYRFIRLLFNAAQLTAECAIVTLVYIERLLMYAEIDITPSNWKRMVLGAILLASKVWDDQAVWNVDYCQILKDLTVEDMNELERQFLEMLQFNINVPSSVYAKYYFDLRALADAKDLSFPLEPLNKERAQKLEAITRICEEKAQDATLSELKRTASMDGIHLVPRYSAAIIS